MNPMFDVTKSATVLVDTDKLQTMLSGVESAEAREYIIKGFIADQNRNAKSLTMPLATDSFANIVGMETFPLITTEEFGTLMLTLDAIASGNTPPEQIPALLSGVSPVVAKLKQYNGVPSLQTCFDAQGFSSEAIATIPELENYNVSLYLTAHIRIDPKPKTNENEQP